MPPDTLCETIDNNPYFFRYKFHENFDNKVTFNIEIGSEGAAIYHYIINLSSHP